MYDTAIPTVAVLDFTNNTTFDVAKVLQVQASILYQKSTVGAVGIGIVPRNTDIVYSKASKGSSKLQFETISRDINAKLGESVAESVAATLVDIGSVKVFTRRDLTKVLQEQQFQQSGLVDEKTLVKLGKLVGVKYIITGSINNVSLKWIQADLAKRNLQNHLGLIGTIAAVILG